MKYNSKQNLRISTEMEDPDNIDETREYHLIKDNFTIYDEDFMVEGVTEEGYLCLYKRSGGWRMWEYGSYSTDEYDRVFFTQPGESDRIYPYYAIKDGVYISHPTKRNLTIPDRIAKGILKPEYYTRWWHERDSRTKIMDTTKEQDTMEQTKEISKELYDKLEMLGIIDTSNVRENNVGQSNYAEHTIQPWSIWLDYKDLTPWDADIIKRILRTKDDKSMTPEQQRTMDYNKIIHICQERIRQIQLKENQNKDKKNKMKKEQVKLSMDEIRNRNISFIRVEMSDCMPIENGISDIDRDINNGYIDIEGIDNPDGYKIMYNISIDVYLPEFDANKCYLNDFDYSIMNLIDRCTLYMRALVKLNNSNNGGSTRLEIRVGSISNLPNKLQDKIKVKMDNLNSDTDIKMSIVE